ncbi:NADPH-dependent 2,4-dienoyl-CoA reductase, sulfur reductase [Rhizobiales bacterium GAS113]|nr:NADPH-dependent 2,4-dienoyl-CoA reductase, sulfur reductase [Rhizobiales bacterium GAS113]
MAGPRVIIVGAGPAGVRAAERLAQAELRPLIVDEAPAAGGQIYRRQPTNFRREAKELYGFEAGKAQTLHGTFEALKPAIEHRSETLAWNVFDGKLHLASPTGHEAVPFDALILATGATDRIMPVPGWTKPGVTSLGGAQIALKAQACAVGAKPVFLGTGPLLYLVAYQYAKAGVRPAALLDTSPFFNRLTALPKLAARPDMLAKGLYYSAWLSVRRIPVLTGITPVAIEGERRVTGTRFRDRRGRERSFDCDAVGLGYGLRSETQLADLARCRFTFDPLARQWLPATDQDGRTSVPNVYIAGDGARIAGADAAELAGRLAACAALTDLGHRVPPAEFEALRAPLTRMASFREGLEQAFPWPAHLATAYPDEALVCRCEAVTAGELRRSAQELGALEVNRAKAFSRVGMGRCQGRYCGLAGAEILAAALGVTLTEVGRLRGQAPVKPLALTAEAGP